MLQLLRKSLAEHKDRHAFCINEHFYSYRQLLSEAKKIGLEMNRQGGSTRKRVGIVTANSLQTYASIIACWLSGYAYIPLNPKLPAERNSVIIEEAGIDFILTPEIDLIQFDQNKVKSFVFNAISADIEVDDFEFDTFTEDDNRLMYILFTSGSTGVPKGVPIDAGNVKTFLKSYNALQFQCSPVDRFLQMFDLTFDVSVASFLVPLLSGACVYTVPADGIKYMNVYKVIKKHKITFASIVPSIINYLKPYFKEINLPDLKYCILTAEASNVHIVKEWANCIPNGRIVNLYGPTEATIWCTGYFFNNESEKSYNEMMIIGKPFKHVEALILNELGEEMPAGEKGELNIASNQLTKGYLNDAEKNKSAFFFKSGKRFYKTGDLCYVDKEGDIFYCGRIDHQVKIQGFRIELSEIEVTVRELFAVNNVAVAYRDTKGVDNICLFTEALDLNEAAIREGLGKRLPYYMLPAQINNIQTLPYNTSGKVDRVGLSQLASGNGK